MIFILTFQFPFSVHVPIPVFMLSLSLSLFLLFHVCICLSHPIRFFSYPFTRSYTVHASSIIPFLCVVSSIFPFFSLPFSLEKLFLYGYNQRASMQISNEFQVYHHYTWLYIVYDVHIFMCHSFTRNHEQWSLWWYGTKMYTNYRAKITLKQSPKFTSTVPTHTEKQQQ